MTKIRLNPVSRLTSPISLNDRCPGAGRVERVSERNSEWMVDRRVFTARVAFFWMFQRVQLPRVERGPDAAGALPTGCAQRTRDTTSCAAN